jgi:predicted Zn-dependent protease with MMP-like domain
MAAPRVFGRPPTDEELVAIANAALAELPAKLLAKVKGIAILVEDFPDDDVLDDLGLESPYDLLGLYQGVSLDRQGVGMVRHDLDRILLYRGPILNAWCDSGEDLEALVRNTLIHEIGHHVGLSDEDMERLETEG